MLSVALFCLLLLVIPSWAGPCELPLDDDTCVWTYYRIEKGVTFAQAAKKCKKSGDTVAQISDEKSYQAIAEFLRSKIPDYLDTTRTWIGLEVDPLTGDITNPGPGAFAVWDPVEGLAVGAQYEGWTNVYLQVDSDASMEAQGMINYRPTGRMDGVLCQKGP